MTITKICVDGKNFIERILATYL